MEQRRVVLASLVCAILLSGLQASRASASNGCEADEFYCYNTLVCIPASRECDGVRDCFNGEDEYYCECSLPFEEVSSSNDSPCVLLDVFRQTWQEARDACLSLDADLAVLNDWDFYGDLIDYMHQKELAYLDYWVGASDEAEEGVWTWVDGTPLRMGTPLWGLYKHTDYPYHDYQEPYYEYAEGEDCGYLYADQYNYMVDGTCTTQKASVCQKKKTQKLHSTILPKDASFNATTTTPTKAVPATKTCTAPFEVLGRRCVWLAMEQLPWLEALYLCQRFGADLASVSDIGLHANLVDYFEFKGVTGLNFWIGANDTAREGQWRWQDDKPVRMGTPLWRTMKDSPWGPWLQEPHYDAEYEDCGILDYEAFHYMADAECTTKLPAICLMP